jgi:hypothetical protein
MLAQGRKMDLPGFACADIQRLMRCQYRQAAAQEMLSDDRLNQLDGGAVQCRERLIQNPQSPLGHQQSRQRQPTLLPLR